jgi:SAM-dependent methyltransferase
MKYQNVSQLYDAVYGSKIDDMQFYRDYIGEQKALMSIKTVLEIGVGTGRILLPMAQAHPEIRFVGLDVIGDELEVLDDKGMAMGLSNIETVCIDFMDYRDAQGYDVVTAPFRVLQHCLSVEEIENFFINVNDIMASGGKFVFDLFNPSIPMLTKTGIIFQGEYDGMEGSKIFRDVEISKRDYFLQTQKVDEYYNIQYTDGNHDKLEWKYETRYFFKDEILPLLQRNNFIVDELYSNFARKRFGEVTYPGDLIFVCSKPVGP